MDNNTLKHAGVKGMKWGVRRYQNADGSLTPLGKKRYARDASEKEYTEFDSATGQYYKLKKNKNGKVTDREELKVDADRYLKEDLGRSKKLVDESATAASKVKQVSDTSLRNRPKTKMDLSNMTDQQMRERINREMLERQYNDLFAPKPRAKGREYLSKTLEVAGNVLMVGSSALGIALAVKELRG